MMQLVDVSRRLWAPLLMPPLLLLFLSWKPATAGPTICPFAIATGHACPLCGGTRAAAALLDGDVAAAWTLHPLVFAIVPLMMYGWVAWLGVTRGWWEPPSSKLTNRVAVVLGALFFGLWAVRALTGTLPPI